MENHTTLASPKQAWLCWTPTRILFDAQAAGENERRPVAYPVIRFRRSSCAKVRLRDLGRTKLGRTQNYEDE